MLEATRIFYVVFAFLALAGGIMGFVRAGSRISLFAGALSAVLLCTAAVILARHPHYGLFTGLFVSVLLAGKFVPDFLMSRKFLPGGLMAVLSAVSIAMTILSWQDR